MNQAAMPSRATMPASSPTSPCVLLVRRLSEHARLPTRGSAMAVGLDLYSATNLVIPPRGRALVMTDLAIALPPGTYGRIAPRSGLALRHGIDVGAGVIDRDYRGNVGVLLLNSNNNCGAPSDAEAAAFEVRVGDRVAQLICELVAYPHVIETTGESDEDDDDETARGAQGFGSTGCVGGGCAAEPRRIDEAQAAAAAPTSTPPKQ